MGLDDYEEMAAVRRLRGEEIAKAFQNTAKELAPGFGIELFADWDNIAKPTQEWLISTFNRLIDDRILAPQSAYNYQVQRVEKIKDAWRDLNQLME